MRIGNNKFVNDVSLYKSKYLGKNEKRHGEIQFVTINNFLCFVLYLVSLWHFGLHYVLIKTEKYKKLRIR